MKNFVQEGDRVSIAKGSLVGPNNPIKSGDPVVCRRLAGVAVADAVPGTAGPTDDGNVVVALKGVFSLSVQSLHETGIAIGETVFINPSTGALSDDYAQTPYGVALDPVTLGSTTAIRVKLFGITFGVIGAGS